LSPKKKNKSKNKKNRKKSIKEETAGVKPRAGAIPGESNLGVTLNGKPSGGVRDGEISKSCKEESGH